MASAIRSIWEALVPLGLFLACTLAQIGCTCAPAGQAKKNEIIACKSQHERASIAPPLATKTIVPGTIPASFAITDSGDAALTMPIAVPPGRTGVEPSIAISYNSSAGNEVLGMGFAISGGSSITRCPKNMAMDGEIRGVQYDENDALCLDGKRLVVVGKNGDNLEYRTFPDTQVKVVGHFANEAESYFEAFLPSGWVIDYGKTPGSRPLARGGGARAWLASSTRDARGNSMSYGYCFAESDDGFTAEYALDEINYTGFGGEEGTRVVSFVYGTKEPDDVRRIYTGKMALQSALRLDEVQTHVNNELVRRYEFSYEQSETTGRTRLTSVQECGADGGCKPETRFQYGHAVRGFDEFATTTPAPISKLSSPMLADFNGDGLDDLLTPDTTAISTPDNPITEWRIAQNQGNALAIPKVALLQEWSVVQDPQGPAEPSQMQPELGTAIDYDQDGRMDVLLHDVYGSKNNHIVLLSKADGTLGELDTNIKRPFPLGPAPKQLRSAGGSVHLADVDGDGVGDLIQCEDHDSLPEGNPSQPVWKVHLWRPGGFENGGTSIEMLAGFGCGVELRTIDVNRKGKVDLVLPGMINIGGTPATQATTYSALERKTDGTWNAWDTKLPIPPSPGRVIFADVNGDGLPDAIANGLSDGRLRTWMNTEGGFTDKPADSLKWDGIGAQDSYFHLATPLDWDGDGRTDLLMPMGIAPELPKWFVLRATGGSIGFTFERIDAGIPFEAQLGEAITLADPRGPRVGDVNGDGAPDVVLFIGNELHVFRNRAADPDVLVSFSDGLSERAPDDSNFVPNVSFSYGHLTDEWITNGEQQNDPKRDSYLYLSRAESNNDCAYPRRCAVGSKRVVREYAVNDGQGGQRRFGLQYRDGRYDRRGYGFLGFGARMVKDLDTGATTATFSDNMTLVSVGERSVYPFVGQAEALWRWAPALPSEPNPNRVEMVFNDNRIDVVPTNEGETYFTIATQRHTRRMQGTFSAGSSLETWVAGIEANESATMLRDTSVDIAEFDAFGNVLRVKASTIGVDLSYEVTRVVKNDPDRWILGQVQNRTECSTAGIKQCRSFAYMTNEFGEVESESTSSDDNIPDTKLTVEYDKRDKYGNVEHVTARDEFGHVRESTTVYDDEGIYPRKEINARGHETSFEYDSAFGALKKVIDPNQLPTEWQYDSLGRETREKRPDGSQTTTNLTRAKMEGVWRLFERTTTSGGADDETIFDSLGRPIRTFSHGPTPAGQKMPRRMQVFQYDRLNGKIAKRSVLTASSTPDADLHFDSYEFDSIGREIRHTTPWNATTTTSHDGFIIESVDFAHAPPLHTRTELDALGRPKTITDAKGGTTKYTYGPFGALQSVTDPGNDVTRWTRDAFGRVRQIDEPDRGTTQYVHDGFGDLVSSTDALGRVATFGLDELGRVETRTDSLGAQVLTTKWTWDKAPNGIGQLQMLESPDAIKTYSYSKRGQLETEMLAVVGESFVVSLGYDDVGHVESVDYPQPLGQEPFGVMYEHDEHGFVVGVRDKATSESFWDLREVDDAGRIQKERFGNGVETLRGYESDKQTLKSISTSLGNTNIQELSYAWDSRLNLKSRTDALQPQNKTERFRYDELDRVTCAYFGAAESAQAVCATSYDYQLNGNLTLKSDIGVLQYKDNAHPHAVSHANGQKYGYDAVGNQIARPGGVSIAYAPFDLPKTITKGGKTVSFGYDGDEQRVRKSSNTAETLYFGDLFEQVTSAAGAVERRYYVHSPERAIAIVTRGGAAPGTRFLHVDHLASIDVVTRENGDVDERRSYDAFGARRNPEWGLPGGVTSGTVTKGFTGHEEEDEFGLVNMKGRLLDPHLGRFTTTDPIIADIWDGQSFAAYAYVRNNPLTFVDPSGFDSTRAEPLPKEPAPVVHLPEDRIIGRRPQWAAKPDPLDFQPVDEPAKVGATAPPVDVSTTGSGGESLPRQPSNVEPGSNRGFLDGVWDGAVNTYNHLDELMPDSHASVVATTVTLFEVVDAYKKGDVIDAVNVVNPLMPLANVAVGVEEGDWYTVGVNAVAIGVTVVAVVVSRKLGPKMGPGAQRGPPAAQKNGRLGNANTRAHVALVADEMESRGWEITHGGGRFPEEYLPGPGGARKGSSYPDITATKGGKTIRVNTVDTRVDGVSLTTRETLSATRIRAQTGEHLLTIPKPKAGE